VAPLQRQVECEAVYSFVLDSLHIMLIGGVQAICMGHGFQHDAVLQHPFYGTAAVVDNLKTMRGWEAGCVVLRGGRQCVKKDPATKLVVGLLQDYDEEEKEVATAAAVM
jgi:hypothetical protein